MATVLKITMRPRSNLSSGMAHRHPLTASTCGITAKLCTGSACWRHVDVLRSAPVSMNTPNCWGITR